MSSPVYSCPPSEPNGLFTKLSVLAADGELFADAPVISSAPRESSTFATTPPFGHLLNGHHNSGHLPDSIIIIIMFA